MWKFMTLLWDLGNLVLLFLLISDQETLPLLSHQHSSKGNSMSLGFTLAMFHPLTCTKGFGVRFTPLGLMGLSSPSWWLVGTCWFLLGSAISPMDLPLLCCGRLMREAWRLVRLL